MRWTSEQDAYLADHAGEGAEAIRRGMHREFGITRSEQAIEAHANRLGLSLVKVDYCEVCGLPGLNLVGGMCRACKYEVLAEQKRAALAEMEAAQRREAEARREYQRVRVRLARRNADSVKMQKILLEA